MIADTLNILKATKITPKKICYYTASPWKWQIYLKVIEKARAGEPRINEIMKESASDPNLKPHMKEVASLVPRIIKVLTKLSTERQDNILKIREINELKNIKEALDFLRDRFKAEILVYSEDETKRYDPKRRAVMAMPNQPAIFIE